MLALAVFVLYAIFAARDVMFGDGPELIAAAISNGVVHPPGYPLWIVLGHLLAQIPIGSSAYRVNLTASLYHAVSVALVYLAAYRLTGKESAAFLAALLPAIASPIFVAWSLQAEVFSLNDLFAAAIIFTCIAWLGRAERMYVTIFALAVLFGFGISNQQTLVLLAPIPLWIAWCNRASIPRTSGTLFAILASFIVGIFCFALPYVHTLLASRALPAWQFGSARTFPQLIDLIDRKAYGGSLSLVALAAVRGGTMFERLGVMLATAGWPISVMFIGAAILALRRRYQEFGVALLVILGPVLLFCAFANMNVSDELARAVFARFGLLGVTALAPFSAVAFAEIQGYFTGRTEFVVARVAMVAAILLGGMLLLPQLSLAREHGPRNLYRDVFATLPSHALLLTAGDAVEQAHEYFQGIEGLRPDVVVISYGLLNSPAYLHSLRRRINVPASVAYNWPPQERRDLLVAANPNRPFYTLGDRAIHANGRRFRAIVTGVVSAILSNTRRVDMRAQYRRETHLQSTPRYGKVSGNWWRSNGFGPVVREYYAAGFFVAGIDAERLGKRASAIRWYRRAQRYFPDPLIAERLTALGQ